MVGGGWGFSLVDNYNGPGRIIFFPRGRGETCHLCHRTLETFFCHQIFLPFRSSGKRSREDDAYLCQDCDVVLTMEPCIMCAMALVHSRVKRVAFWHSDMEFGGFGGRLALHQCQSLNHTVRVLQWQQKRHGGLERCGWKDVWRWDKNIKPMKLAVFFCSLIWPFLWLGKTTQSFLFELVGARRFTDFFLEILFIGATNRGDMIHII